MCQYTGVSAFAGGWFEGTLSDAAENLADHQTKDSCSALI